MVVVRVTHKGIADVEDQFELQFGTTTLYSHLICHTSPYSGGINEQYGDIVLESSIPECAGDSAMEDAESETQEVAVMATATRTVQLPSTLLYRETSVSGHPGPCLHLMLRCQPSSIKYQVLDLHRPVRCCQVSHASLHVYRSINRRLVSTRCSSAVPHHVSFRSSSPGTDHRASHAL